MSNPDPLNTHNYDGKLCTTELDKLCIIHNLPLEEKREYGRGLILSVTGKINVKAMLFLRRIVQAMGTQSNIDKTNNLAADDLICLCWEYKENPIFLSNLEAQLIDMSNGFCPQGRTHRLFQLLLAFQPERSS